MHIPDGYLSPQTWIPAYGAMAPLWALAASRSKRVLRGREAPLVALSAAFSFVVMMFNVPAPGGTSGHAVGAVLVAILLGPWTAVLAVSAALAVQALLFGDGGLTALAANCLNMAVLMPFSGYAAYRLLAGDSAPDSRRRQVAAGVGGYLGLNVAAFATAVQFGIQPSIAHDAAGSPLYCPFGLGVAVPAMMLEHILLFGFVEAAVTGLAVAYLGRTEPWLLRATPGSQASPSMRRLLVPLALLVLLTPIGLLIPAWSGAGAAWGEWGADEVGELAGAIPRGLQSLGDLWGGFLPGYGPPGDAAASPVRQALWYLFSAGFGTAVLLLLLSLVRPRTRRDVPDGPPS